LLAARAVLLLEPMPLPRKDGGEGSKLDPDFPEPWWLWPAFSGEVEFTRSSGSTCWLEPDRRTGEGKGILPFTADDDVDMWW
jgi:hypothetical protein